MKARRERRVRRFDEMIARHTEMLTELEDRARFRRELNASNLSEPMKTVLGYLADPVGAAVDAARKVIAQQGRKP
jgi:hypothetical protein